MFCPVCKTEYRTGFTRCADCGVDLVSRLPEDESAAEQDVPTNSEGLELLWTGVNQSLSDQLDEALDAAHIFHKVTDKEFGLLPNFTQRARFIWIDARDRTTSHSILEKVSAGMEQQDHLTPPDSAAVNPLAFGRKVYNRADGEEAETSADENELPESDASGDPLPEDSADDPEPDEATAEVWSGDNAEMAQYLVDCLHGVGIGCVVTQNAGKTSVRVLPTVEKRAREVVREIVDASPPR